MIDVDLVGRKFERLQVMELSHRDKFRQKVWKCLCDCGNYKNVTSTCLLRGKINSCTCLQKELASARATIHGHSSGGKVSPERRAWSNIKNRCYNAKSDDYYLYGERGIKVCDRWLESFGNFLADMGYRPSPKHSIDRIDVNGNYEPNNCKWATIYEQARNKRVSPKSKSGVVGVTYMKKSGKWRANISANGKDIYLGEYADIEKAIQVRKEAEIKYWHKEPS